MRCPVHVSLLFNGELGNTNLVPVEEKETIRIAFTD
jgi:hypothetical protein